MIANFVLLISFILIRSASAWDCCELLGASSELEDTSVWIVNTQLRGAIQDEPKLLCELCICNRGIEEYRGFAGIEIRGSSSAREQAKKSFSVELRSEVSDDDDEEERASDQAFSLSGLPADADWVLYAPESDRSFLRNDLAYWIGRQMVGNNWTPSTAWVELFIIDDGTLTSLAELEGSQLGPDSPYFRGLYMLTEAIRRGKHRVDVHKSKNGGYIFKHDNDNIDEGDVTFYADKSRLGFVMTYPKGPKVTPADLAQLRTLINDFESKLVETSSPSLYREFIDIASFVDYFLATELTKNPDGYRGSTFLHVQSKEGTLRAGPMWDYNESFGLCCGYPIEGYQNGGDSTGSSGGSAISPNGWRFNICEESRRCLVDPLDGISQYYRLLWEDQLFRSSASRRWKELRQGPLSDDAIKSYLEQEVNLIRKAAARNLLAWQGIVDIVGPYYKTWDERWRQEIHDLEEWVLARARWMDDALGTYSR